MHYAVVRRRAYEDGTVLKETGCLIFIGDISVGHLGHGHVKILSLKFLKRQAVLSSLGIYLRAT